MGPLSCLSVCNVDVLWPNGWMDQDATWYRGRHPLRRHRVRWGPSSPYVKGRSSPHFSAHVYCGETVAHLGYCWALVFCFHWVAWLHALRSSWFGQRDYNNWYRNDIDANDSALHRCRGNKCWWMTIELAARPKEKNVHSVQHLAYFVSECSQFLGLSKSDVPSSSRTPWFTKASTIWLSLFHRCSVVAEEIMINHLTNLNYTLWWQHHNTAIHRVTYTQIGCHFVIKHFAYFTVKVKYLCRNLNFFVAVVSETGRQLNNAFHCSTTIYSLS